MTPPRGAAAPTRPARVRTPAARRKASVRAASDAERLALRVAVGELPVPEAAFRRDAVRALRLAGWTGRLSLALVDDRTMRRVNRDFHAADRATDVLAFPLFEPGGVARGDGAFDAEVVVSVDTAVREARRRGVDPAAELMLYVVHGVLHLLGEDDHDPLDARRMHARTLAILSALGHVNSIGTAPGRRRRGSVR